MNMPLYIYFYYFYMPKSPKAKAQVNLSEIAINGKKLIFGLGVILILAIIAAVALVYLKPKANNQNQVDVADIKISAGNCLPRSTGYICGFGSQAVSDGSCAGTYRRCKVRAVLIGTCRPRDTTSKFFVCQNSFVPRSFCSTPLAPANNYCT
jgi:hypothetical protein